MVKIDRESATYTVKYSNQIFSKKKFWHFEQCKNQAMTCKLHLYTLAPPLENLCKPLKENEDEQLKLQNPILGRHKNLLKFKNDREEKLADDHSNDNKLQWSFHN